MNAGQLSEFNAGDKRLDLLNLNNLVRAVKKLLATTYDREHFEIIDTGTSRTIRARSTAAENTADDIEGHHSFKVKLGSVDQLVAVEFPFWDRNAIVAWGTADQEVDLSSVISAGATHIWVRAIMTSTMLGDQNPVGFTITLDAVDADVGGNEPPAEDEGNYDSKKYLAYIDIDPVSLNIKKITQTSHGVHDHLPMPDDAMARTPGIPKSSTIMYRDDAVNSARHRTISLHGAHNDAACPEKTYRIPINHRQANQVAYISYVAPDADTNPYDVAAYEWRSIEVEDVSTVDQPAGYLQIYGFRNGSPNDWDRDEIMLPVRYAVDGGARISWVTWASLIAGDDGDGGSLPPGFGTLISHHDLQDLTTNDDHGSGSAHYLQLHDTGTYGRNTAQSGTIKLGGDVDIESEVHIESTNDDEDATPALEVDGGVVIGDNNTMGQTTFGTGSLLVNMLRVPGSVLQATDGVVTSYLIRDYDGSTWGVLTDGKMLADTGIYTNGGYFVDGTQVLTNQQGAISTPASIEPVAIPTGTDTIDIAATETLVNDLIGSYNVMRDRIEDILDALRAHGLIAT